MFVNRPRLAFVIGIVMPLAAILVALCIGRYALSPVQVAGALAAGPANAAEVPEGLVVYNVRLPRILLSFMVGAGLSVAGCCFQSIFSNPLASPDTIGVSSGSAFGAALGILLSGGMILTQASAILFGLLAIAATFILSGRKGSNNVLMIVLAGVITAAFFNALVSAIKYLADPTTKLPEITYWLMGSMMGASWHDIRLALPIIGLPVIALILLRWRLNILTLPEDEIASLGVNVRRMRWAIILLCTVIIAVSVSVCGQVGWVGLVIPHIARRLVGTDHRFTLPACVTIGGTYLLMIDTLARSLSAGEIPLSILTALFGVPLFVILFFRRGGYYIDA